MKEKIFYKKYFIKNIMAWYKGTGKENHKSFFENVSHDYCIFCVDRTEITGTGFKY